MSDEQEPAGVTVLKQQTETIIPSRSLPPERGPWVIGGVIIAMYFCLSILLSFIEVRQGSERAVGELTTTLRDAFMAFIWWLYGKSKGENRKDAVIERSPGVDIPH